MGNEKISHKKIDYGTWYSDDQEKIGSSENALYLVDFSQKKLGNEFQNLSKSSLEKIKKAYMFIGFMRFFSHKYIYIPRKQEETSKKNKQEIDDLFKDLLSWSGKIIGSALDNKQFGVAFSHNWNSQVLTYVKSKESGFSDEEMQVFETSIYVMMLLNEKYKLDFVSIEKVIFKPYGLLINSRDNGKVSTRTINIMPEVLAHNKEQIQSNVKINTGKLRSDIKKQ